MKFTPFGPKFDPDEAFASLGLLGRFLDEVASAYDVEKTVLAGFSQGGIMSACLALTKPEAVAGFAMLSGRIPSEIAPMTASDERLSKTKAFVSHGIRDEKLPLFHGRDAKALLERKGVEVTYGEYDAAHQITREMENDFGNWIRKTL